MRRGRPPETTERIAADRPRWSTVLQALREASGITQDSWAFRLGVSLRTVQRWEAGERAPDPGAENGILAYCDERELFRAFDRGPFADLNLTAESLRALFAEARTQARHRLQADDRTDGASAVVPMSAEPSNSSGMISHERSLPAPISSFVGRQQELATVRRKLGDTRLLTLTGVGGCGKTRLALQLAGELLWAYPNGVWFAELAALSDPALVPQTVGATLGLHPTGPQPIAETLLEHLASRHLLLILDNCEHLLPACAALIEKLLRACPHLEVLTTSREPLGIIGETVWRVPSLSLLDAVSLFVERARLYQPDLALTVANATAIEAICERLDGIPLALELAAARVRILSVEQIAARLHDSFHLLTGGSRTALTRQQTLRATLDWSHDLLSEPEQAMLRQLAVFAGDFTLEAAEAVGHETDTLDTLTSLVDKSLVLVEEQDGTVRYQWLETVRRYAAEKLDAAEETVATRDRHRDWYLTLAEQAEPELLGPAQVTWLARLEEEHDNLRAALAWSLSRETPETALRLAGALVHFWERRGHLHEGRQWLAQALAAGPGAPAVRAKALRGEGTLASLQGDNPLARTRLKESLTFYRALGDARSIAEVHSSLGWIAFRQGEYATARDFLEAGLTGCAAFEHTLGIANAHSALGLLALREGDHAAAREFFEAALTLQRAAGNTEGIANALEDLAIVAGEQGEHEEQIALLEESLTLFYRLGSKSGIALVLGNLGMGAWLQGDTGRAMALLRESLTIYREVGDRRGVARLLGNQSFLALSLRDCIRAADLCCESLALYRESSDAWGIGRYLPVLAGALFAQGQSERAAQLFGAATALRDQLGTPLPPVVQPAHDRTVADVRLALGSESFTAAWTQGQAMSPEEAVAYALVEAALV